ncbi:T9SS type A sorting domain-containing protein, partial [bacterium]|nr:T9SS type A sorting domain-containing protein [bacterium]
IDENYQPLKLESGSDTHPDYDWAHAIDHDVLSTNCKVQAMNTDAQAVFAFTDDAKKVVSKIRLMTNTAMGTTFANHLLKDFALEVSVDGTNWETAFEGTITQRYDWQVFEFDGAMAKFVKLVLKSARGAASPWVSISEFQVFGTPSESIALNKDGVTDVIVTEYALAQNYPNPFNPSTTISFSLPQDSNVKLSVFNICGQEVAALVAGNMSAGTHQVEFDARNLNSGTYFYRIEAGSYQAIRRMILVK